jgi:hypothetical protein
MSARRKISPFKESVIRLHEPLFYSAFSDERVDHH